MFTSHCSSLPQLPLKVIRNHREQMHPRIFSRDAVRLVGIDHQPELLPRLDQRINHLNAVLKVDIVVARAMYQQQRPVQLVGVTWSHPTVRTPPYRP